MKIENLNKEESYNIDSPNNLIIDDGKIDIDIKSYSHLNENKFKKYLEVLKHSHNKKKKNEQIDPQTKIRITFIYVVFSNIMNIFSILVYIFQSMYENNVDRKSNENLNNLVQIDFGLSCFFLSEYILSPFVLSGDDLKNHFFSYYFIIDMSSIMTSMTSFFIGTSLKIQFIRIFRTFKIYKLLKLYTSVNIMEKKMNKEDNENTEDNFYETRKSPFKMQFFKMVTILCCYIFIGTGIVKLIDDITENAFSYSHMNFFDAFYFIIITTTSVGYGDIIPTNFYSRSILVMMIFIFLYIISEQLSKLSALLSKEKSRNFTYEDLGHYIIIYGGNDLNSLRNFMEEIRKRDSKGIAIIIHLINEKKKKNKYVSNKNFPFNKTFTIYNNQIEISMLKDINITKAKVIFILCQKKFNDISSIEKLNEHVVMKIDKVCENVPIYIQTLFSKFDKIMINEVMDNFTRKKRSNKSDLSQVDQTELKFNENKNSKFKKMIPIFKIKKRIIAKSLINPGFMTFIQNLILYEEDDNINNTSDKIYENSQNYENNCLFVNYIIGCENKIKLIKINKLMIGMKFKDLVSKIYELSIFPIFEKNFLKNKNNIPILLIGINSRRNKLRKSSTINLINDTSKSNTNNTSKIDTENNSIILYPINYIIGEEDELILITNETKENLIQIINNNFNKLDNEKQMYKDFFSEKYKERNVEFLKFLNNKKIENKKSILLENSKRLSQNLCLDIINNVHNENDDYFTIENELLFKEFEDKNKLEIELKIIKESSKRFGYIPTKADNNHMNNFDHLIEERIFNIGNEKDLILNKILNNNKIKKFKNHILIIGFQDNLFRLIKLIQYHFDEKDICILNNNSNNENKIKKLMKECNNLFYIKCDPQNPENLIKVNLPNAYKCLILIEKIDSRINEDLDKILLFKSIDNFFDIKCIMEIWNEKNISHLGYNPINYENLKKDFVHPLYMSGNLFYESYLEKIVAKTYFEENEIESALQMVNCGYEIFDYINFRLKINKEVEYPVIITIKIPQIYVGRQYNILMNDLLCLDPPCLSLGIYIKNPLLYYKKEEDDYYLLQLEKLKPNFHKGRASPDFIDVNKTHLPIFITNPKADFIIQKETDIQLLIYHKISPLDNENIKKRANVNESRRNELRRHSLVKKQIRFTTKNLKFQRKVVKNELMRKSENFYKVHNLLMEKYNEIYFNATIGLDELEEMSSSDSGDSDNSCSTSNI